MSGVMAASCTTTPLVALPWRTASRLVREVNGRAAAVPASFSEALDQLQFAWHRLALGARLFDSRDSAPVRLYHHLITMRRHSASAWAELLDLYGHRGIFECDIACPRFREDPAPLAAGRLGAPACHSSGETRSGSLLARLLHPVHDFHDQIMRAFETMRRGFIILCRMREVAPEVLWCLDPEEVRLLDHGWRPSPHFRQTRLAQIQRQRQELLPQPCRPPRFLAAEGVSGGIVQGRAWVLSEPPTAPPGTVPREETILVAPTIDIGWIPALTLVAGVVIEEGGAHSPAVRILQSIQIPALASAAFATSSIHSGDRLRLDPSSGCVETRSFSRTAPPPALRASAAAASAS
jgi:phosphohistidine swiveling domain-containing protein